MVETPAPKVLLFDIECSNLRADFGNLLCVGYKWLGDDSIYCPAIHDYRGWTKDITDSRKLLKDFVAVYNSADIVVSYNGKRFDVPWLNAKLFQYEMPFLAPVAHVDLYYAAKSNLCISRKSLQNVAYHGGFQSTKTPVEGRIWLKAGSGHKGSLKYIIDHCIADIELLEEAYLRLRPLVRTHPHIKGYGPCRFCGSERLQRRGKALTILKTPKHRYHCQSCGGWQQA